MANFARNVRFGLRLLLKNLGFTSVALLALILGIGATTALFSLVNTATRPKPSTLTVLSPFSSLRVVL